MNHYQHSDSRSTQMNEETKVSKTSPAYKKYYEMYDKEDDTRLFSYYKTAEGDKKAAISDILSKRGYSNFQN